jgi:hypothetical protein
VSDAVCLSAALPWCCSPSLQDVYNPPNAVPLILERTDYPSADATWVHTKAMYRWVTGV